MPTSAELREQIEELQWDYEDKCNELVERTQELEAARHEIEELKILLKSAGKRCSSVVATGTGGSGVATNPQEAELLRIFLWLAEHAVLEEPTSLNADCNVVMAGKLLNLHNIVQWRLRESDLKLSVPDELAPEITSLLSTIKLSSNTLCEVKAKAIIDSWSLTTSPGSEATTTVTLLTHHESQRSCLVADFPSPPRPQPQQVQQWVGPSEGDIVELNFEGQWLKGTVKIIKGDGIVVVHCDIDPPEVLTTTSVHFLRRLVDKAEPQPSAESAKTSVKSEVPLSQDGTKKSFSDSGLGGA